MATGLELDFNNTKEAFRHKSNAELKRAAWMFGMLNHSILGPVGKRLLKMSIALGLPVKPAIKATLYKQFVGGETLEECLPIVNRLTEANIKSILDYSVEGRQSEEVME